MNMGLSDEAEFKGFVKNWIESELPKWEATLPTFGIRAHLE